MHLTSLKYFSAKQIQTILDLAVRIKKNPRAYKDALRNKSIGLLFEKPSLRTKTAFHLGVEQLGGNVIYYSPDEVKLGVREEVSDVSRTLSRFLDGIVLRTFSHQKILEFVRFSSVPVINALSDRLHPSQVLGDLVTIYELKKNMKQIKVAFIGDGNNVCNSLLYSFSILGGTLHVATPASYAPAKAIMTEIKKYALISGAKITLSADPRKAAKAADIIYTDVWVSMGKEGERTKRKKAFKKFQINDRILTLAKKKCLLMHCLPAHRGEEITDTVMESARSVIFQQAENRLHSAKAILIYLLRRQK